MTDFSRSEPQNPLEPQSPAERREGNAQEGASLFPDAAVVPPTTLQPHRSRIRSLFFGAQGLRAGWRFVIFLALFNVCAFGLSRLARLAHTPAHFSFSAITLLEAVLFGSGLIASGIMGHFEKRSYADYGLPARGAFGARFWEGILWGFVALSVLLLALHATGNFDYGTAAVHGGDIAKYALIWGGVFLLVGFAEEYTFRGYALFTLSTGMSFWPAAVLLSALFGLTHLGNPGESWLGGFMAGFIGLFFCLTLRRTGSLWFAIGAHLGWDWGETFLYGVPDSGQMAPGHLLNSTFHGSKWLTGGTVGPEASVLALVVVALMWAAFNFRFGQIRFPRPAAVPQPAGGGAASTQLEI